MRRVAHPLQEGLPAGVGDERDGVPVVRGRVTDEDVVGLPDPHHLSAVCLDRIRHELSSLGEGHGARRTRAFTHPSELEEVDHHHLAIEVGLDELLHLVRVEDDAHHGPPWLPEGPSHGALMA